MTTALKPPFTYFGGKLSIAEQIVRLLPAHRHYVEPFAGSLAVLLTKPRSVRETVNDLDGRLMTFWRVLRERPVELERACFLTPHARAEHATARVEAVDELEQARQVWILLTQGRGGYTTTNSGWRYYQDGNGGSPSMPVYLRTYAGRLAPAVARIDRVSLECMPALDLIRAYGRHEANLIYADPPYLASVRALNKGRCRGPDYAHELRSDADHTELLEALLECSAAVVLSGYPSPLYDRLLAGWDRREIATSTGNGGTDRARVEVLWSNRPFPHGQDSLFDMEDAS